MSNFLCYLCGKEFIPGEKITGDHVVPQALLEKRAQPKVRGIDYAGFIRTHRTCNNHFSDETFFRKALHLVELSIGGTMHNPLQSLKDPSISILPVTEDQIPNFGKNDFDRFKFIDTRQIPYGKFTDPKFFEGKPKTNLLENSMHAAMTVMAKSSAALLVKRYLRAVPSHWLILASPYDARGINLDDLFQGVKPFDRINRAKIEQQNIDEWSVLFQHKSLLVSYCFVFHRTDPVFNPGLFHPESEIHRYAGTDLNRMLQDQWHVA